jgi:hypothetical protein
MEQIIVAMIVALWLVIFVLMSMAPFFSNPREPRARIKVVSLDDRRRSRTKAA